MHWLNYIFFKNNLFLILNLHEIILYVVGDMLVGLNDIDVTWVNLDDLFRALSSQQEVSRFTLTEFFSFLETCVLA